MISDIKKIAKHYLKGSCIFDFLAIVPFELIFTIGTNRQTIGKDAEKASRMFKMIKFFRIPRLFELLNVDRVKSSISDYFNKNLREAVQKNDESDAYPLLKALMIL